MSTQSHSWPVLQRQSRPTHPHVEQGSQSFWYQGPVLWKTIFPWTMGKGDSFLQGAQNLDPSHTQCTVEFMLQWESNATSDLTGGRAQAVIQEVGSGCKFRWDFCSAHVLAHCPCCSDRRGPVLVCGPRVWEPLTWRTTFLGLSQVILSPFWLQA